MLALALALGCAVAGCSQNDAGWQKPSRGFQQFQTQVLPVMLRDCAFSTCHGSPQRFLQVWGPGRVRLDPMTREFDNLTADEATRGYQLALSMIDPDDPSRSLLLRKPLAVEAGGAGHRGEDKFGRNLYRSVNDQGYLVIARWVLGRAPTPAQPTTGSTH
ncbi:MAG: hypothetical protein ACHQ53_04190 [Polyangiales bacterium]